MSKSNIIIHKADCISDYNALAYIQEVIRGGRISNNGSYCSVTTFKDGVIVYEQIIKALEYCSTDVRENTCPQCTFYKKHRCSTLMLNAVSDLINRQKAKIEELKNRNAFLENEYKNQGELFWERVKIKQSEAMKEFAEQLKSRLANLFVQTKTHGRKTMPNYVDDIANQILHNIVPQEIDNLVKEMTEDAE